MALEEELEVIRGAKERTREHREALASAHAQWVARLQQLEAQVLSLVAPGRPSKLVPHGRGLRVVEVA